MRKLSSLKYLVAAAALSTVACSTTQRDAVQVNSPAPAVMRGSALTNVPPVNSAGPASMTVPSAEALAITSANANRGGTFLGYIEGVGPSPSGNYTPATGQVIPPSLSANPEITVNSSISSGPNPIITSGAGEGGGLFVATAAAPVATNAGVSSAVVAAPITTTGTTASAIVSPITTGVTGAAPIIVTPSTVATPTNTANVLTVGQFAAGAGGATNTGSTAIVNSGPLPVANGNTLVNGNTGTLTPTVSSSFIPSPTVASNPAVAVANNSATRTTTPRTTSASTVVNNGVATGGTRFAIGPNGMTSSSTITNNSNGSIITTSAADQLAARRSSTSTTASVTNTAMASTGGARLRAVRTPASGVTQPVTQPATSASRRRSVTTSTSQNAAVVAPASSRQHAIRVTTSTNGTPVVTNVNDNAFMERAGVKQRDQASPNQ